MREFTGNQGDYSAGLTGDEKAILLHRFCEMLSGICVALHPRAKWTGRDRRSRLQPHLHIAQS
jgi:hypothetical protein